MRKTKIVCTLGPATDSLDMVRNLMTAGLDVARFNFSHGSHEEHAGRLKMIQDICKELQLPVAALLDTKGPEIRVGTFENKRVELKEGDTFTLTTRDVVGTKDMVSISYQGLPEDVKEGTNILIDDGLIGLIVKRVQDTDIVCQVINGGPVSDRKSVNVPSIQLSLPYMTEKDVEDIRFGVQMGFDFIAASFTRTAADIMEIREILAEENCDWIQIIAKIENRQGVNNIDDILRVSDGIMVARGDLGVEVPMEDIPSIQKHLIKKARKQGKIVITATQMLDSMMKNPRPTRAEATDVANAIYDGTTAIMLSGETAAGLYPLAAVQTMARIAIRTEQDIDFHEKFLRFTQDMRSGISSDGAIPNITNAIAHATCTTAYDLDAAAIVTVTKSGNTARMISKYRPSETIIGCTPDERVYRQLGLAWGVAPLLLDAGTNNDNFIDNGVNSALEAGLIQNGDLIVLTAGVPLGVSGTTNLLRVHIAGDVLVSGQGIGESCGAGRVVTAVSLAELDEKFEDGDVMVVPETTNDYLSLMKRASAIVTEQGGSNSHAAVVGAALGIPVIVGAHGATRILRGGMAVKVDAKKGLVRSGDSISAK